MVFAKRMKTDHCFVGLDVCYYFMYRFGHLEREHSSNAEMIDFCFCPKLTENVFSELKMQMFHWNEDVGNDYCNDMIFKKANTHLCYEFSCVISNHISRIG